MRTSLLKWWTVVLTIIGFPAYLSAESTAITLASFSLERKQNTQTFGWRFTVNTPITITKLGVFDADRNGLAESHQVGIWVEASRALIVSTNVPSGVGAPLDGDFRFVDIVPRVLPPGSYIIGAFYRDGGPDWNVGDTSSMSIQPQITYTGSRYSTPFPSGFVFPDFPQNSSQGHFGPNFKFVATVDLVATMLARDVSGIGAAALGGSDEPDGYYWKPELVIETDENGDAHFTYIPAEVAGIDTIKAEVVDPSGPARPDNSAELSVDVSVPGLLDMTTMTRLGFTLFGVTDSHPRNWFASPSSIPPLTAAIVKYASDQATDRTIAAAIGILEKYGYDFVNEFPSSRSSGGTIVPREPETLFINDISLPKGGLFDEVPAQRIAQFHSPHAGHRNGNQYDLKTTHLFAQFPYDAQGKAASKNHTAVGDPRLERGEFPFTNHHSYVGPNGKPAFYDDKIRGKMNDEVKKIHHRRLELLLQALKTAGGTLTVETTPHIHVSF
jgi:hypothetical protein